MSWVAVSVRILFFVLASACVGWFYGYPLVGIVLALLCLVAFWIYQMHQVQYWLQDVNQPPPDVHGIWGDLLARMYLHERKNRETRERLEAAVEYLQNSLASMRDGVVMVDEQGAIKWLNEAVEPLLGLRQPEDTGQLLTNLVRAPEFNSYFIDGDYGTPLEYTTSGDSKIHLRVEVTRFGEGERLLFVRDVSDAVRLEQIRRDFVANVSHELRTPLTVLSGYLDTFLDNSQDLPGRYVRPMQQMVQQAGRMEDLLNDLLWLARIESAERQVKRELIDVCSLLQELREELAAAHPERCLELEVSTDRKVHGDYRELYSAISNLVNNALKYSSVDSPVTIRWESPGEYCKLQIQDRGIGIDMFHLPRLTERFYRVDDARSTATGGTGLGLAIVKHVAAAHDAQLQIDSELGKGSTFTLLFPIGA